MQILPVIDLMHGCVVHAVAGRRSEYRPIMSVLTTSTDSLVVAEALREVVQSDHLYVADLDAILTDRPAWMDLQSLSTAGFELWADMGVADLARAEAMTRAGIAHVVVGLETCPTPGTLRQIVRGIGPDHVTFSLDLREGRMMAEPRDYWPRSAMSIAGIVQEAGVLSMIVLDLASVGIGRGVSTAKLCGLLRRDPRFADMVLLTGGGVRSEEDLDQLARIPVDFALVSTAIHRGTLTTENLHRWSKQPRGED